MPKQQVKYNQNLTTKITMGEIFWCFKELFQ